MNSINEESKIDNTKIDDKQPKIKKNILDQQTNPIIESDHNENLKKDIKKDDNNNLEDNLNLILDIPIKMTIELGRTKMSIRDLLCLKKDSIVTLDGSIGEPLDILINDYLIARGEVVVMQERYGIRISDIITPEDRMRRLNR
ncbi:MAG: flagellar motor switch protein FliN [Wigglesworthia glossinidia]|uniref:Flagellar motor switch protein FliN-like C-terminal domain-containing protein n=1 Tax=Glossina palpalis gambiensis TaxID=67801 RepID=A0A1B0C1P9_9MUSC|nr:flagellar motor switch protein FliN [Wigglesworthia glossinidia]